MFNDTNLFAQFEKIARNNIPYISNIKPSDWVEQNLIMGKPFPGPFRYSRTPYTREIIDCLSPDHPARKVAVMKGAQIGFSSGVIMPGTVWMIRNNPGNTVISVGAPDLIKKAMSKLDGALYNSGSRAYIKPQALRRKMQQSGDTNQEKEFVGGYVTIFNIGNHKAGRQIDLQYGFFDDLESVKSSSKESGATVELWDKRFAAYADTCKIFYISTPERKQGSNIEPLFLMGDQRYYNVHCPCCHEKIDLQWNIQIDEKNTGGIVWETDSHGHVIESSVGYVCQKCAGFFTDKSKHKMLNDGLWIPTARPIKEDFFSYHINSLYAPVGMYGWAYYAVEYLKACPPGQPRNESKYQVHINTVEGKTYEATGTSPEANSIQENIRAYKIGEIPESLSIRHGNGRIVLLTCAADMNGTEDDARLDWELCGWSESGVKYSINQGRIGTFIPREGSLKTKEDRQKWSYRFDATNSVWNEFSKIIKGEYVTDTGRKMKIALSGLDCGYFANNYAYPYLDRINVMPNTYIVGLKGEKADEYILFDKDLRAFKPAQERPNLYILKVGRIKDRIAEYMQLKWDPNTSESQPYGFMNFPTPANGLYSYKDYFKHYESEQRIIEANADGTGVAACWRKKDSAVQNHFWDVAVYNEAVKDIFMDKISKELKLKEMTWKEFVKILTGGK